MDVDDTPSPADVSVRSNLSSLFCPLSSRLLTSPSPVHSAASFATSAFRSDVPVAESAIDFLGALGLGRVECVRALSDALRDALRGALPALSREDAARVTAELSRGGVLEGDTALIFIDALSVVAGGAAAAGGGGGVRAPGASGGGGAGAGGGAGGGGGGIAVEILSAGLSGATALRAVPAELVLNAPPHVRALLWAAVPARVSSDVTAALLHF